MNGESPRLGDNAPRGSHGPAMVGDGSLRRGQVAILACGLRDDCSRPGGSGAAQKFTISGTADVRSHKKNQ